MKGLSVGGEFIERLLKEANELVKCRLSGEARREKPKSTIPEFCERKGVHLEEHRAGSRRGSIPPIRSELELRLLRECALSLT